MCACKALEGKKYSVEEALKRIVDGNSSDMEQLGEDEEEGDEEEEGILLQGLGKTQIPLMMWKSQKRDIGTVGMSRMKNSQLLD